MKRLAILALPLLLAACNSGGSLPENRPYSITMKSLGYKVSGSGSTTTITVTETTVDLFSAAGAPDVRSIDYTAVMLDSKGDPAGYNQSYITPQTGTLFGGAHGGYLCTTTAASACWMGAKDAVMTDVGPANAASNEVIRALFPFEWAVIHNSASAGALETPATGDTAGWYVQFTFRAVQTNGNVVKWKQNFQLASPA